MKCTFVVGFLVASIASSAQDPDAERGRKLLNDAIEALGGPAYLAVRDIHSEGRAFSFSRYEEVAGMAPMINYDRLPDKFRQVIGKKRDVIYVVSGEQGWDSNFRGVAQMPAPEVERIKYNRALSFDIVLRFRLKEPGVSIYAAGSDFVDGRPVDMVDFADAQNNSVRMSFDRQTHLPVRREWERKLPNREREQNIEVLGKYRPAKNNAAQFPFYIRRERNGLKVFESFLNDVEVARLSDALFQRPDGKERIDVPSRQPKK